MRILEHSGTCTMNGVKRVILQLHAGDADAQHWPITDVNFFVFYFFQLAKDIKRLWIPFSARSLQIRSQIFLTDFQTKVSTLSISYNRATLRTEPPLTKFSLGSTETV